jgi:hypothetical protein
MYIQTKHRNLVESLSHSDICYYSYVNLIKLELKFTKILNKKYPDTVCL